MASEGNGIERDFNWSGCVEWFIANPHTETRIVHLLEALLLDSSACALGSIEVRRTATPVIETGLAAHPGDVRSVKHNN